MSRRLAWILLLWSSACKVTGDTAETLSTVPPCETPVSLGSGSGLVRCADGNVNRASAGSCTPEVVGPACQGTEGTLSCTSDAECNAHPAGRCLSGLQGGGGQTSYCACSYSCATDADCESGEACVCAGAAPEIQGARCVSAACRVNADCASGECSVSTFHDGCYERAYLACRSPADTCRIDADCAGQGSGYTCDVASSGSKPWTCRTYDCIF